MDLFSPIDQYCERTGHGLLAEPINLITNFSFIMAGLLILKSVKNRDAADSKPGFFLLPALILTIGIGSGLFHSFANLISMWADVIPIGAFVLVYFWLFLRVEANVNGAAALGFFAGFLAISFFCTQLANPATANGGEAYFGTWIALFGVTCFYGGSGQKKKFFQMGLAVLVFSMAILFRTLDMALCEVWPLGTHFLWHALNGIVLFLVTAVYLNAPGRS